MVKSVIQGLLEKWHLLEDWPARPWWGFVNASNLQTTLERRYYTNHVYLKYKNHSVCGPDMSCFFIFSVFLEIRFLWWEKLQSGFSHSHKHSSMFFGLSLCFLLLLLIFVLVVGDLDDQAMVRCGWFIQQRGLSVDSRVAHTVLWSPPHHVQLYNTIIHT